MDNLDDIVCSVCGNNLSYEIGSDIESYTAYIKVDPCNKCCNRKEEGEDAKS